jgi:hypothetical protein
MGTVNVMCKLPTGLVLEAGYTMDYAAKRFVNGPNYKRAVLKGAARAQVEQLRAISPGAGFAATGELVPTVTAVDEELARAWFKAHARDYFVRHGLIAIVEKPADIKSMAADIEKEKTHFEPLDPKGDPRTKGLTVEKADFADRKTGWE